jgi:hypothetical protein
MSLSLFPTAASALAVLLSIWFLIGTWSNQNIQRSLQKQQEEIQTRQIALQSQQQQLQLQQQQIDSGMQLANQVGPAMIRDLAELQIQNRNQKIATLLKKYGIEAQPSNGSTPIRN